MQGDEGSKPASQAAGWLRWLLSSPCFVSSSVKRVNVMECLAWGWHQAGLRTWGCAYYEAVWDYVTVKREAWWPEDRGHMLSLTP